VEVVPNPAPNEQAESRYAEPRFDNVNDYNGFAMNGSGAADPFSIRDITDTVIPGLNGYSVAVSVANIDAGELGPAVSNTADALRITVNVAAPAGVNVRLQGYRLRYAPTTP
jgi:MSHA pilin protein MshD